MAENTRNLFEIQRFGEIMGPATQTFAQRLHELRRQHGWSQAELAQRIDTSGAIVGRYERGEMTPSIEVARRVAEVFGVTVDALLADSPLPDILRDRAMLGRWEALEALPPADRERILDLVDSLVRDAQARQAYAKTG